MIDGLERSLSDIERVVAGYPQYAQGSGQDDVRVRFGAKHLPHLCFYERTIGGKGHDLIAGLDFAYRDLGAVCLQDRAFRQEAALVVHGNAFRKENSAGVGQQIVGGLVGLCRADRGNSFGLYFVFMKGKDSIPGLQLGRNAEFPRAGHDGMFGGDQKSMAARRDLKILFDFQFRDAFDTHRLRSLAGESEDRIARLEFLDSGPAGGGQNRCSLAKTASSAPRPRRSGREHHEKNGNKVLQELHSRLHRVVQWAEPAVHVVHKVHYALILPF